MFFSDNYNENVQKIAEFTKNKQIYDFFVLISHDNPDCDSISSVIAVEYMLSSFGKECICLNSDIIPKNLSFFDFRKVYYSYEDAISKINLNLNSSRRFCIIVSDTHEMRMTGKFAETDIINKAADVFYIDHHTVKEENKSDNIFCNPDKSSTCEIIYDIYAKLNIKIPVEIGDAIYAGITSDTGQFRYAKTKAETLIAAAELVRNGTNPDRIYGQLYEQESVGMVMLHKLVLDTLELYSDNRIAVLHLTKEMLAETGVPYSATGTVGNLPLRCADVKVVIFFKENEKGNIKAAMRSKGDTDIAIIAHHHGGGGHRNAAGFKLYPDEEFDDVKNILIEEISQIL